MSRQFKMVAIFTLLCCSILLVLSQNDIFSELHNNEQNADESQQDIFDEQENESIPPLMPPKDNKSVLMDVISKVLNGNLTPEKADTTLTVKESAMLSAEYFMNFQDDTKKAEKIEKIVKNLYESENVKSVSLEDFENSNCNRAELFYIVYNFMLPYNVNIENNHNDAGVEKFKDFDTIPNWAKVPVTFMVQNGMLYGKSFDYIGWEEYAAIKDFTAILERYVQPQPNGNPYNGIPSIPNGKPYIEILPKPNNEASNSNFNIQPNNNDIINTISKILLILSIIGVFILLVVPINEPNIPIWLEKAVKRYISIVSLLQLIIALLNYFPIFKI